MQNTNDELIARVQETEVRNRPLQRRTLLGGAVAAFAGALEWVFRPQDARAQSAPVAPLAPNNGLIDYRKVRALVVGVLQWRDPALATFPQQGRKDQALVDALRGKGCPARNIVFLRDRQATKNAIDAAFRRILRETRADETLLVYYAGHGGRLESAEAFFLPWDVHPRDLPATGWSMREVIQRVTQSPFAGSAIVCADCCYSGTLVKEANDLTSGRPIAVLASSLASVVSTSTWSFTECLIAGIQGRPIVDVDHNGQLTLQDLARFTIDQMAFAEEQLASFTVRNGFNNNLLLATVARTAQTRVGEHVEVEWNGTWYRAQVENERSNALFIHYIGYARDWDEWAPLTRIRAYTPTLYNTGAMVEVEWHGVWYPARILDRREGVHFIHYENYADSWNEWVSSSRIRVAQPPTVQPSVPGPTAEPARPTVTVTPARPVPPGLPMVGPGVVPLRPPAR